ncbi:MAG TPA: SoxR reducing system RseC family protein [Bacillota bacterium]|nr:SoxR reducing system RseC family protein [Bacillota bacterium]HNU94672.1 SoxR reducing system RseC family protein [Bacillota bacterium]HNY67976.1 SoxR reducing system RseC family protein [Bacillota bacterium]
MKQTGRVQSVHGPYVDVLVKRPDACHGCGACKLASDEPRTVTARNDVGASVGDTVEIELSGATLMRAVGLAYGVPLVMFMLGLLLGEPITRRIGLAVNASLASAITAFIFLAAGYYVIHYYDRSLGAGAFMSAATEIVDSAQMECAPEGCVAAERFGGSEENL